MVSLDTSSFSAWKFYTRGIRGFYIFIQDFQHLVPGGSSSPACPSLRRTPRAPAWLDSPGAARSLRHRWVGCLCPATAAAGLVDPRNICCKAHSSLWAAPRRYRRQSCRWIAAVLVKNQDRCCSKGCRLPTRK